MSLRNRSLAFAALPIAGCAAALSVESVASTAAVAPAPGGRGSATTARPERDAASRGWSCQRAPRGAAGFTHLLGTITVPDRSEVDARRGRVAITVATVQPGQTVTAVAYQGRFLLHQDSAPPAETHLALTGTPLGCAR